MWIDEIALQIWARRSRCTITERSRFRVLRSFMQKPHFLEEIFATRWSVLLCEEWSNQFGRGKAPIRSSFHLPRRQLRMVKQWSDNYNLISNFLERKRAIGISLSLHWVSVRRSALKMVIQHFCHLRACESFTKYILWRIRYDAHVSRWRLPALSGSFFIWWIWIHRSLNGPIHRFTAFIATALDTKVPHSNAICTFSPSSSLGRTHTPPRCLILFTEFRKSLQFLMRLTFESWFYVQFICRWFMMDTNA